MSSGRALVLLSLAGVTVALLVTFVAGWPYGLGAYAASVVALVLVLQHMTRQARSRAHPGGEAAGKASAPTGIIRPRS